MSAKILMQEVWMAGVDWDDLLPDDFNVKWEKWVSELPQLSYIAVPCCLRLANPQTTELHLFSDVSKVAFASAAYLVCRYQERVVFPRLELMGAVLSSRLAQNVLNVISVDRVVFSTDSENVGYLVRHRSREFKPFLANQIDEIQRTASPEQWRHIPGTLNPANVPARGLSASGE